MMEIVPEILQRSVLAMKRFVLTSGLAAVAFAAMTLSAFADERPAIDRADRAGGRHGVMRLRKCLSSLDLSVDQKSAIKAIVTAARPTLEADAATVKADRQKVRADIAAGADKSVIGQDVLTAHADAQALRAAAAAVRDQILAKLSPDQQASVKDCLQASRGSRNPGTAGFRGRE
jgi:Spy/CpxP family protein refolding chaperone